MARVSSGPAPSPIGCCTWGDTRDPPFWSRSPIADVLPGVRRDSPGPSHIPMFTGGFEDATASLGEAFVIPLTACWTTSSPPLAKQGTGACR